MDSIVDVVIPNYNKAEYLEACLDSLRRQRFGRWRAIVVDGYSDDGSWDILRRYASGDPRLELHQAARTGCLYDSWNYGIERVRGQFFAILTSDDVWPDDFLEAAVGALEAHPTAACAAGRTRQIDRAGARGPVAPITALGERFFGSRADAPELRGGLTNTIAHYFLGSIYTSIHSLVMRSAELGGSRFAADLGTVADVEWCLRLGLAGDVVYLPGVEVGWRIYEGQASNSRRQRENGRAVRTIHERNRERIARESDRLGARFVRIARDYDQRVLAYDVARPCIANLRDYPMDEFPHLVRAALRFPGALVRDVVGQFRGERFAFEQAILAARRATALLDHDRGTSTIVPSPVAT